MQNKYDLLRTNVAVCGENPGLGTSTTCYALNFVLNVAGFAKPKFVYASASLRNMARHLGVATEGEDFVEKFLKSDFVNNHTFDRVWDLAVANSIMRLNGKGTYVIYESKIAFVLESVRRMSLSRFYARNKDTDVPNYGKELLAFENSGLTVNFEPLKIIYLRGSMERTTQRMLDGGRIADVLALKARIAADKLRYIANYGLDPYDARLIIGAGIADIELDTTNWNIQKSMTVILAQLFGQRFVDTHLSNPLAELGQMCDQVSFVEAKKNLIHWNEAQGKVDNLDVSAEVVDNMKALGYTFNK